MVPAGSISSGTLNPQDLIPRFYFYLGVHEPKTYDELGSKYSAMGWPYSEELGQLTHWVTYVDDNPDRANNLLNDLTNVLEELAPGVCISALTLMMKRTSDFGLSKNNLVA